MNSNTPQKIIKLSELRRPNTINSLKNLLSTPDTSLAINVPCPNLDFPRWHIDIAHDYLASLVVGESLAQYCKNIEANFEGLRTVFFTFNTKDIINLEDFITKLIWLDKGFKEDAPDASVDSEDERDDYDYDYEEFRGEMEDFADKIETLQLNFPELGDKYMANIIPEIGRASCRERV